MSLKLDPHVNVHQASHPAAQTTSLPTVANTSEHEPKLATQSPVVLQEQEKNLNSTELERVDVLQDVIMEKTSPDGRPPTHQQRRIGWGVLLILGLMMLVVGLAWAMMSGVSLGLVVGLSVVSVIVLVVMGTPVWAAGVSRGKEEAKARDEALGRVQSAKPPEHGTVVRK